MKALNVFIKNLKILIRSRSSALIMLLGPLIVILLVGMSFNTSNKYELNVGVFVDEKNELTDSFITKMKQANLQVSDYTNKDFCVNDVKTGTINICLYFPRLAIENNATNEIVFFVDPSKVNLVTVVMNAVSSKVSERSEEITRDLTTVLTESLYVSQQEATSMKPLADSVYEDLKVSRAKVKDTLNRVEVLKLNYSMSSFKPQDFSDSSLKVNMSIENLRAAGYEAVEKGWELIAYTEEHMSGVPNSSEKNNIMIKMSLTKRDFDALNATLNRRSNFSDAGIGTLFALVSSLEDNLRSLDASLAEQGQAIEATKTQGTANLNDVYARTDRDVADMEKLKASIDKISSSVASVQVTNVGSISKPVRTTITPVIAEKTLINYLFSSIIVLVVMFICLILASTLVVSEKNSLSGFRSAITPTSNFTFFIGTFFTVLFILVLQSAIIIGVSEYLFHANLLPQIKEIAVIMLLVITTFTLVGMLLGHLFKTEETATIGAISVGSVFLFVSNLVLPLESISAYARKIAQYNPFVISDTLLQKTSLFGAKLSALVPQIQLLGIYCGVLFVAIMMVAAFQRTNFMHRIGYLLFTKRHMKKLKEKHDKKHSKKEKDEKSDKKESKEDKKEEKKSDKIEEKK